MDSIIYAFRFLYRIRYWLIICPVVVAGIIFLRTDKMPLQYEVKTTIYTGVMSGYDIESGTASHQDQQTLNNAMDNLVNLITSQTTLKNVSMRLYAENMMYGDPKKDNNYLRASNYRWIYGKTPPEVRPLIDKNSEEKTLENLWAYEKPVSTNFIYGLFNYTPRYYSYRDLSKITVRRMGNSDMLEIRYTADDPGIAYNTLVLLNKEFIRQYELLRFGETNNVIDYFQHALDSIGRELRATEDSLTAYNVEKRIINYDEQTKHVASLGRDYQLKYEDILLNYNSSGKLIRELEGRIDEHVKNLKDNANFLAKLKDISDLSAKITMMESFQPDTTRTESMDLVTLRRQLDAAEKDFTQFADQNSARRYTKEGISSESIVGQWLEQLILHEKAQAQMKVMDDRKAELDSQYVYYSPIGSTIKRKQREIDFTTQSYLSILQSLNAARLRQKNLQMNSATLKVITPPTFPLESMPSKRKMMVVGGFVGTIIFILGIFFLLELLDRTLRDKSRAERLTGGKVLGAVPRKGFRRRSYHKEHLGASMQYLGNALLDYCKPGQQSVINILSLRSGSGKSFVAEHLAEYFRRRDIKIGEDVILAEYKALYDASVPASLLEKAAVNLLVLKADSSWKDTDQLLYDRLAQRVGDAPLFICLTQADQNAVETFTGQLPPYTFFRKLGYRFYQLGLTSAG